MTPSQEKGNRKTDRRIQRTRQDLQRAFKEIIQERGGIAPGIRSVEKSFLTMSIQEITERANVNRGTFYLHFTDKYMLAETIAREQFYQAITRALPPAPGWNRSSLSLLTSTLLDNFEHKYHHQQQSSSVLAPLLERATHEELTNLLLTWLRQDVQQGRHSAITQEATARIVSWAIFGSALQWSQEETMITREQMTNTILQIITEGTLP